MRAFRINNFNEIGSPISYAAAVLVTISTLLVVFHPSLVEIGAILLLDVVVVTPFLVFVMEPIVFPKLYPQFKLIFPRFDMEKFEHLTDDEDGKRALFETLLLYPRQRAFYTAWMSFVYKVIPGILIIAMIWQHEDPFWLIVVKYCAAFSLVNAFVYGAVFIELHDLVSRTIRQLH